ncbi:hypothetical protein ACSSS7_001468 [Eimeria intestinalis]
MALSRLLLLTVASVLLLDSTAIAQEDVEATVEAENTCLEKMNEARNAAGFPALTKAADTPTAKGKTLEDTLKKGFCKILLDKNNSKPLELGTEATRTCAFFALGEVKEGEAKAAEGKTIDPQCSAAVKKWQEGFNGFKESPPVDKGLDYSKSTPEQVSFVTLYNPRSEASGQCAVATCEVEAQNTETRSNKQKFAGLVCCTAPSPFDDKPLFT